MQFVQFGGSGGGGKKKKQIEKGKKKCQMNLYIHKKNVIWHKNDF